MGQKYDLIYLVYMYVGIATGDNIILSWILLISVVILVIKLDVFLIAIKIPTNKSNFPMMTDANKINKKTKRVLEYHRYLKMKVNSYHFFL